MKVSIVIPTRNRSCLLERSVRYAYLQEYDDLEVVVSNNNSEDSTCSVLKSIKQKYPSMIVVSHKDTLPLNQHWDKIITQYSTGELILLIPDDDILTDPRYVNKAVSLFKKYPSIGLVFANYQIVNENSEVVSSVRAKFDELVPKEYLFANYNRTLFGITGIGVSHLTTVFSRKSYCDVNGFDLDCMSPDTHLWLKILLKYDAGFISDEVAHYLVHETNLSKTANMHYRYLDIKIAPEVERLALSWQLSQKYILRTLNRMNYIFYRRLYSEVYRNVKSRSNFFAAIKYFLKSNPLLFLSVITRRYFTKA